MVTAHDTFTVHEYLSRLTDAFLTHLMTMTDTGTLHSVQSKVAEVDAECFACSMHTVMSHFELLVVLGVLRELLQIGSSRQIQHDVPR